MQKICPKCGKSKDYTQFYRDRTKPDGLTSTCKQCRRDAQKSYRKNNVGSVKTYEDKRRLKPERKEYSKEYQRKYRHYNKIRVDKYDVRTIARKIINDLINAKKLRKALICEISKDEIRIQYHHTSYEYPHVVVALSHTIHEIIHKKKVYINDDHIKIRKIVELIGKRREEAFNKYGKEKYLEMFNKGII